MTAIEQAITAEEIARKEWEATYDGPFTIAELREAFEKVTQGMRSWRDRIDTQITVNAETVTYYRQVVERAVQFFTATSASVTAKRVNAFGAEHPYGQVILHVTAAGYRAGPAGDH